MKSTTLFTAGTVLVSALLISSPMAATAAESPAAVAEIHCVVEAVPITIQGEMPVAICFGTAEEVSLYLGEIGVGNAAARGALDSTVLGTAYSDANGGGSSFTFWGSSGCYGVVFGFPSLPAGWNNTISSAGGSNGCWLTLYSTTSYGGSRLNCTPWCGSVYGLNDAVQSIVFRPTGTFG